MQPQKYIKHPACFKILRSNLNAALASNRQGNIMDDIKSSNDQLQAQSFPRCSCLGTLDSSNKCICENGWTGTECNNLKLDSIAESLSR